MRIPRIPLRDTGPERPTHFHEDQNERVGDDKQGPDDYTTESPAEPVEYGFLPPAESTAVYLTEAPPKAHRIVRWRPFTYVVDSADSSPEQVLSNDVNRTRAVLSNVDAANAIYLAYDPQNKNAAFARILPAGKDVEMLHNTQLYAFSLVGTPNLAVHIEYELDPPQ